VLSVSTRSLLSAAFTTGRSSSVQSAFRRTKKSRWTCVSETARITDDEPVVDCDSFAWSEGLVSTFRSRNTIRVAVDVVAGLERSREQLVRIAGDLNGAHRPLQLRADALRCDVVEPADGHLLAGVDRAAGNEGRDLVRIRDCARYDVLPLNRLDLQLMAFDDVCAGGA
jgi:hypothetical protein